VCLADLSTAHLASLIAAGAADAVGYPIAPDVLARKVDRVLRRRR
jgi:serine/threonine-protein kinase